MKRSGFYRALPLLAGLALNQPTQAVNNDRSQIQTGSNMCMLSVPTTDTKIRPRANGFKNEGTTNAFVICSFDAPPGANLINGNEFTKIFLFLVSLDGIARDVTCTGVNSIVGTGADPLYVPETWSVTDTGSFTWYTWEPEDFGGTNTIPYSGGAFSVTCNLPPQVSIVAGRADSLEDVGD